MSKQNIYKNILGNIVKKGKSAGAKKRLDAALLNASNQLNSSSSNLLYKICDRLGKMIEIRNLDLHGRVVQVPFPLDTSRRRFMLAKDIINAITFNVAKSERRKNLETKLADYALSFFSKKGVTAIKQQKKQYISTLVKSRSNAHYRW